MKEIMRLAKVYKAHFVGLFKSQFDMEFIPFFLFLSQNKLQISFNFYSLIARKSTPDKFAEI